MNELDEFQKKAVYETGNILLIAGAGAGKTFTIIKKIEYLVDVLKYKPEEILIISFTNKSVNDLKRKIKYNCSIYTFHKFAINILSEYNNNLSMVDDNYLEFITDEFFKSLTNKSMIYEILTFFKEYNYNKFLTSYKYKEFITLLVKLIKIYKTNNCNVNTFDNMWQKNNFVSKYVFIIKTIYEKELKSTNSMDFDDLIINATNILNKFYRFKYIFVDEFQDTSLIRFNLINKLRIINKAYIFAVGDDYQSIYHFSGCDINLFLDFPKLIPNSKVLKLKYTYRNSQELIDIAAKFIMKNKKQLKKDLISNKRINNPIKIIYYINPKKSFSKLYKKLKIISNDVLVLGRNNSDIKFFVDNEDEINFLTVHSSKGLEAENIILINMTNKIYGFPNKIKNHSLLELLHPSDKDILFSEERRLFYVALTRTKNKIYILVPIFNKSCFIKELKKLINKH